MLDRDAVTARALIQQQIAGWNRVLLLQILCWALLLDRDNLIRLRWLLLQRLLRQLLLMRMMILMHYYNICLNHRWLVILKRQLWAMMILIYDQHLLR